MKQITILLVTVLTCLFLSSCENEEKSDSLQQTTDIETNIRTAHKVWERMTWAEVQNDLQFLEIADELGLDLMYQVGQIDQIFIDSSTISKCSDITNGYYSFTFPVHSEPSSPSVIKNVILEKKGLAYKSNIIEYAIGFDDLYALMSNTFSNPINIPIDIYPIDPNTIQLRGCVWVTITLSIPCTCENHFNPDFCTCPTQPIVVESTYLECDDTGGGDDEGIGIYPSGDTNPSTGGGGGDPFGEDDGDNSGTEFLIPTYEWYQIKLKKLKKVHGLEITLEELEDIIPIECMGDGNPLVGEFEECAIAKLVSKFLIENPSINSHVQTFLDKHPTNPIADDHVTEIVMRMLSDKDFKSLVESSFGWSSIMWTIAKELVGDKAVDILAGIVGAKDVRDAIKALKNNDWIEFTFEISQLVLNNTPVGKFLKILEAGSEMYKFAKKVEKIWDKIGNLTEEAVTTIWDIAKKSPLKINGDYLKYLDEIKVPKFGAPFATSSTYSSKFKQNFPEVSSDIGQVHHAVPQAAINKYPNLNIQSDQMHSLENLRGIPSDGSLDHQTITNYWAAFYNSNPNATLTEIFDFTKFIDDEFGHLFIPPIR